MLLSTAYPQNQFHLKISGCLYHQLDITLGQHRFIDMMNRTMNYFIDDSVSILHEL